MVDRKVEESPVHAGLWRGLDLFRPLALAYASFVAWENATRLERPGLAAGVLAVLGLWSLGLLVYRRRDDLVLGTELALACAAILLSPLAEGPTDVIGTLPSLWAAAPVMGWAIALGLRGGVVSTLVVAVADVAEVGIPTEGTIYNIVTLMLLGGCLGACSDIARRSQRAIEQAVRLQAENAERERLARAIHDGVLQALTYIHKRGAALGGEAAELGELAAAQERALRSLALGPVRSEETGPVDVRALLAPLAGARVTVSSPAAPVRLSADRARELTAAVEAALSNVDRHAGEGARAWVLLEDLGGEVVATVRDDGVGYAAGRREQACAEGRLGIASSIDGRVRDLGGSVHHRSVPGHGTTVEISVPAAAPVKERA